MSSTTERQKMLAGELYDARDPELVEMRRRARSLFRAYNATSDDEADERERLLRELFGRLGEGAVIEPPFYCDYGAHIFAGERLYMNFGCTILDPSEVHVGDDVFVGPQVQIITATHPVDAAERIRGPELARAVRIGDRVWLGAGVIVGPGVTIGTGSTVGAGSVVVKDIPPDVVAVGNPARVIRRLR